LKAYASKFFIAILLSLTFSREHAVTVLIDGNIVLAEFAVVCAALSSLHVGV
jgi:hypothetical protein